MYSKRISDLLESRKNEPGDFDKSIDGIDYEDIFDDEWEEDDDETVDPIDLEDQTNAVVSEAHGLSQADADILKNHLNSVQDPEVKRVINFVLKSNVLVPVTQNLHKMKNESVSHQRMLAKYGEYFGNYKRPADVSSKIRNNPDYDIDALVKRRTKDIPPDVPFGVDDILSDKELNAIMNHPGFKSMDANVRDSIVDWASLAETRVGEAIDQVLIDAFLSNDKVLKRGLPAESAYRAGMATHAEGHFRLSELGERHAKDLLNKLIAGN